MKKMGDSVVSHVDSRVGKRFDEELRIPRKFRTETVRTSASPLTKPSERILETVASLCLVGVHSGKEAIETKGVSFRFEKKSIEILDSNLQLGLLQPSSLSVVEVPLVTESDDTLVS